MQMKPKTMPTPNSQNTDALRPSVKDKKLPNQAITRMAGTVALMVIALATIVFLAGAHRLYSVNETALAGVRVGGIDVSGQTQEQIVDSIARTYNERITSAPIYVYVSELDMTSEARNPEVGEFDSIEEVRAQTVAWATDATELDAQIDYGSLAAQALQAGKDSLSAKLGIDQISVDIPVSVNINNQAVDNFAQQIDYTLGDPYDNFGVEIDGDTAYVTEGHDGYMVDRSWLAEKLSDAMLQEDVSARAFVANVVYHKVQIDEQSASNTADLINAAIANGIDFTCGNTSWSLNSNQLAHWIRTEVMPDGQGAYKLQPYINPDQAKSALLVSANGGFAEGSAKMSFEENGDSYNVVISGASELPMVGEAVDDMDKVLFGGREETPLPSPSDGAETPHVEIRNAPVVSTMTLDEALEYGIVTIVSEYTTEYTEGAEARNHNIHLAAKLLDGSITQGGGIWSFNNIVGGECDEEKGFQAAGAIVNNETIDAIGGGICQVATTVFNAAYQAGYEIVERNNHSLYIASYPAGRDATISWPDLDLQFKNETASDILLEMSYTDSTVTATIYGIDPGYTVSTETGELLPGQKSKTRYEYDPELGAGGEYTKSYGSDGQEITVMRLVYDSDGNKVHEDTFHSNYDATDTIIVQGDSSAVSDVEEHEFDAYEEYSEDEESVDIEEEW